MQPAMLNGGGRECRRQRRDNDGLFCGPGRRRGSSTDVGFRVRRPRAISGRTIVGTQTLSATCSPRPTFSLEPLEALCVPSTRRRAQPSTRCAVRLNPVYPESDRQRRRYQHSSSSQRRRRHQDLLSVRVELGR
ncbi:hypothetical protein K438DRAFT_1870401 [Mycena galopus ATCC 62051]|nr:hypothetical protein K438DRAFT_1870401 [Mycena galopus ATCC 62051]